MRVQRPLGKWTLCTSLLSPQVLRSSEPPALPKAALQTAWSHSSVRLWTLPPAWPPAGGFCLLRLHVGTNSPVNLASQLPLQGRILLVVLPLGTCLFLLFPEAGLGCFLNRHFWGCNSFCSNKCFYSLLQPSPPLEG